MDGKDILLLIAGAIISLVINYITQYTSIPLAKKFGDWRIQWVQNRALKSVNRAMARAKKMDRELATIEYLVKSPFVLQALAARVLQRLILRIAFLVFLSVTAILFYDETHPLSTLWLIFFIFIYLVTGKEDSELGVSDIFKKIVYFRSYAQKTREQIAELRNVVEKAKSISINTTTTEESSND